MSCLLSEQRQPFLAYLTVQNSSLSRILQRRLITITLAFEEGDQGQIGGRRVRSLYKLAEVVCTGHAP
jgi:hypothetical protein